MVKRKSSEKTPNSASILLLREEYYLFSDLSCVLNRTEGEADGVKGYIMKDYWLNKLTHELSTFPECNLHVPNNVDGIKKAHHERVPLTQDLLLVHILNLPEKTYAYMSTKTWDFYQNLINEGLRIDEGIRRKATTDPEGYSFEFSMMQSWHLPNLAVHIKDLISVLRKNDLGHLVDFLPKPKKETKRKVDRKTRDAYIMNKYYELYSKELKVNISKISREIEKLLKTDKDMDGARVITASRIRKIIYGN